MQQHMDSSVLGEILICKRKLDNTEDSYAVTMLKDVDTWEYCIVSYL